MPISRIDYSLVDLRHLGMLQQLLQLELQLVHMNPQIPGTADFLGATDEFRNKIGVEIERQGRRQ